MMGISISSLTKYLFWKLNLFQNGYNSNSTEELNNEMRNLESVMKDLNAIAAPSTSQHQPTHTQC